MAATPDAALRDSAAAKSDVDELRRELGNVETKPEAKIETSLANLKVDILRWPILARAALGGCFFATIVIAR